MKRPYLSLLLALGFALALAPQCVGGHGSDGVGGDGTGGLREAGPGEGMTLGEGGGGGDDGDGALDELCGVPAEVDCVPDIRENCRGMTTPGTGGTTSDTTGGSGGTGGTGGAASTDGAAGMAGQGGQAGAPNDVPIDGGSDVPLPTGSGGVGAGFACRVSEDEDGEPVRTCAASGRGDLDAPCTSAADCMPGLACVVARSPAGDEAGVGAGVCRQYCCRGSEACAQGSYCTPRVSRGLYGTGLSVPVCEKADNCSLAAPYPCEAEEECQCDEGKACLVVRSDGTTTCTEPGEGMVGDECPCAWGHVCSQATGTCLKLCALPATGDGCEGGLCQMAADLPENWGVCIATTSE